MLPHTELPNDRAECWEADTDGAPETPETPDGAAETPLSDPAEPLSLPWATRLLTLVAPPHQRAHDYVIRASTDEMRTCDDAHAARVHA